MNLHYVEDKETAKQLIESVTLDERENLILLVDENQYTALHEAAANGKTDVVEYLCSLPLKDELILAKDNKGETALHFSINQKVAQLLVESVVPEKQRYFILSVTKDKLTALHVAAANGRTDVVEYLCSLSIIDDELILKKDAKGWTPLHYAENREVAKLLVESVLPENRKDFILSVARNHCTALHVAAESGRTNVVEYLCSLSDGDLILKTDKDSNTALHYAENKDIAKLLIESVRPERQKYLALSVDKKQRTALHRAAHKNRVDVVEYLCSLSEGSEELILKSDSGGWTALYCVHNEQIAKILVESVTPEHLKEFLLFVDKSQRTALHVMVLLGRADVVEYLCSLYSNDGQLFLRKDSHGRTVLHCAEKKVITKLLVNSVTPEIQKDFILSVDNDQCTALHLAAENGRADVVEYLCSLSLVDDELILKKDSNSSTALHYAGNKEIAKLLVESVTPTERKSLIFSVTESQCTALHTAAKGNRIGVVEYLCSMYPSSDELILKVDNEGRTALHLAQSRMIAELIVKSLPPERQESFVFLTDENEFTALHTAAISGKIGVIKYFSTLDIDLDSILTKEDCFGRTALHYAKNKDIAKLLIESLSPSKRHDLIMLADEHQCTALHLAALSSRMDVVEMLCHSASDQLLLRSDSDGWTALHIAKTKDIAQLLIESVAPEKRRDFILSVDDDERTALHLAAGSGLTDVVEYLCSFSSMFDGFILQRDVEGCTALHLAKTGKIAEILVESFPRIEQENFLLAANKNMCTSLHMAVSFRRVSVVEYLSNYHSTRLLAAVDANGRTALHLANDEKSVEIIMKSFNSNTLEHLLACEDWFGHTPVLSIVSLGSSGALNMLLNCIEQNCDSDTMAALLQKRNNSNQNIWHLAALSPFLGDLYSVLQEYSFYISNIENIMHADVYGNTPIHYVAAKYNTRVFADFMLHLPLPMRQHVININNTQLTNCRSIIHKRNFDEKFYFQKVLCDTSASTLQYRLADHTNLFPKHVSLSSESFDMLRYSSRGFSLLHSKYYRYDEAILKVLKYCLNEYSLFTSALHEKEPLDLPTSSHLLSKVEEDSEIIVIDTSSLEESLELKQEVIQGKLNDIDSVIYSGKPKIAVIQSSVKEADLNLIPPGPDYLILSVKYYADKYARKSVLDMEKHGSIHSLITVFTCDPAVQKVGVNSTLSKRYIRNSDEFMTSDSEVSRPDNGVPSRFDNGELRRHFYADVNQSDSKEMKLKNNLALCCERRGKALILCNQYEYGPLDFRRVTLQKSIEVFKKYFGFEVEVQYDLSAEEMLSSISEFSRSEGHGSMAALTIFSHGYQRSIMGADNQSLCSVQEVVDSFNTGNVQNIPKLLFLSYCRGGIPPQYNRTPHSFESSSYFQWPENEVTIMYQPIRRGLDETLRRQEWSRQPTFPPLEVPVDCYIMFSTLPDSKSRPGLMFKCLSKHLRDLTSDYRSKLLTPFTGFSDDITGQTDRKLSTDDSVLPEEREDKLVMKVNLLDLLTDVAGIMRDTSRSTQYANLCYTVDRNSQQIFIDIFKPSSESAL